MAKYRVYFTPVADQQVMASYEWGIANWGVDAADKWVRDCTGWSLNASLNSP